MTREKKQLRLNFQNKVSFEAPSFGDADAILTAIEGSLQWIEDYAQELLAHAKTLTVLLNVTEKGRAHRSEDVRVHSYELDGMKIIGMVQSQNSSKVYRARITLNPRGHNCQCRDWQDSRGSKGPCKHIVALGREFWEKELIPELQNLHEPLHKIVTDIVLSPDAIG